MLVRVNHWPIAAIGLEGGRNCASVVGRIMKLEAKMIGITPAVLTRSGMCVLAPPYMRRPTMSFAYWTGILRVAWVMTIAAAITATMSASRKIVVTTESDP